MQLTALCIRLLMNVLLLLVAQLHFSYSLKDDAGFPQVTPNRQQHFEYEPIVVSCEGLNGLTGWRVLRKIKEVKKICASTLEASKGPCKIKTLYPSYDSGEYWCEMGGVQRSNTVNITVTAGSVILESPALPVMEGDNVTLRCRKKQASSNLTAGFYKDGFYMGSSSTAETTIPRFSKSDEGLYKCSISEVGESLESWLTVRAFHKDKYPSYDCSPHVFIVLRIFGTILLAALGLVVGLLHCRKPRGSSTSPSCHPTSSPQTHEEHQSPMSLLVTDS